MKGKLLIYFNQKTNTKASLMYDLKDCCVKGNCYENKIDETESNLKTDEEFDPKNWKCLSSKLSETKYKQFLDVLV